MEEPLTVIEDLLSKRKLLLQDSNNPNINEEEVSILTDQDVYTEFVKLKKRAIVEEVAFNSIRKLESDKFSDTFIKINDAIDKINIIESEFRKKNLETLELFERCNQLRIENEKEMELLEAQKGENVLKDLRIIALKLGVKVETSSLESSSTRIGETITRVKPNSEEMFGLMRRMEECIFYLETNSVKPSEDKYLLKFNQLFVRGIAMMKRFVTLSVERKAKGIRSVLDRSSGDNKHHNLYYTRFSSLIEVISPVIAELEGRINCRKVPGALISCQQCYAVERASLLKVLIAKSPELMRLRPLAEYLRVTGPYLVGVCTKEHELFFDIFDSDVYSYLKSMNSSSDDFNVLEAKTIISQRTTATRRTKFSRFNSTNRTLAREYRKRTKVPTVDSFGNMIISVFSVFYKHTKPMIVQISNLDSLCEAARILESELIETLVEPSIEVNYPLIKIFEIILEDVQQRLIFCSSKFIKTRILKFTPTDSDIDYPTKLMNRKKLQVKNMDYSAWYPSLERTIFLLSKLFRCLEIVTFNDILETTVKACISSLKSASTKISSPLDSQLFLIKQLLVLREQLLPFNSPIQSKNKLLNLDPTARGIKKLFSLSNSKKNLFQILQETMPVVEENRLDCRKDIDGTLRVYCDAFILKSYNEIISGVSGRFSQLEKIGETVKLKDLDLQDVNLMKKFINEDMYSIPTKLEEIGRKLVLYLPNDKAYEFLYQPIKSNVFAKVSEIQDIIKTEYETKSSEHASVFIEMLNALRATIASMDDIA